jgi:hypothetical protein
MDPRERKRVLGQWGVREPSPRETARGRALQEEVASPGLNGRTVELRRRNFRPAVDSYIAALGGPLPYMQRLRQIEEGTEAAAAALQVRWRQLAEEHAADPAEFERRWLAIAERGDYYELNRLIEIHNRWYPAEARLRMDVRRRDFALIDGESYRKRQLNAEWVLERFPADLRRALSD